jgi:hypothetical protein
MVCSKMLRPAGSSSKRLGTTGQQSQNPEARNFHSTAVNSQAKPDSQA